MPGGQPGSGSARTLGLTRRASLCRVLSVYRQHACRSLSAARAGPAGGGGHVTGTFPVALSGCDGPRVAGR
ncbi:hypothetical protein SCATT_p00330 (plasmid) [Streptantibioticus cattleyicolor NRRL 8057 = DSM 46488]|uniref:Uncharacterized protein n=1 Tax=Streptantibioticus cattleyicolor (strain ATCC 35852 / DSM 46488 / JCM 4925 / NBRC 14057 / NRRL 8057) TaxID=1003195 RepID=G8XDN2_STREN|nr:hypothetical protein SCATT_p00330 [Streptantibioticus cattleyicolor NRRL 8057 = DSM 46488]